MIWNSLRLLVLAGFLLCDQLRVADATDTPGNVTSIKVMLDDINQPYNKSSSLSVVHDGENGPSWLRRGDNGASASTPTRQEVKGRSLQIVGSKTGMTCRYDMLGVDEVLSRGEAICDTIYDAFGLDKDGYVVWLFFDDSGDDGGSVTTLWQAGGGATTLKMQKDGNLVARNAAGKTVWSSGSAGNPWSVLVTECSLPACRIYIYVDDNVSWEVVSGGDWPTYPYVCRSHTLLSNQVLGLGEFLCAGEYRFGMTSAGTLRLQRLTQGDGLWFQSVWKADQKGKEGRRVKLNTDGNLVVYDASGVAIWSSKTSTKSPFKLTLYNGGHVKTASLDGTVTLWEPNVNSLTTDYGWNCVGESLPQGKSLVAGEFLCKGGRTIGLVDGTLVVDEFDKFIRQWRVTFKATLWTGGIGDSVSMGTDGSLAIYSKADAAGKRATLWKSLMSGYEGTEFGFSSTDYLSDPVERCIGGDRLLAGSRFNSGDLLCVGEYEPHRFGMDVIGDLAKWNAQTQSEKLWSASTGGSFSNYAIMQADGNFVVRNYAGSRLWSTGTGGNPGARLQLDKDGTAKVVVSVNNVIKTLWKAPSSELKPKCISGPVAAGQRFERNEMLCDGIGSFGLDISGRLTRTAKMYYLDSGNWIAQFYNMGGKFGDYAVFQKDGNFVVYTSAGEALWSTRTNVDYPKETMDYVCMSRAICELIFSSSTEGDKEWSYQDVHCRGHCLPGGSKLFAQEFICSENNGHRFGIDATGDLGVWVRGKKVVFERGSGVDSYGNQLSMQRDANLILKDFKGKALWKTGTSTPGISNDSKAGVCIDNASTLTVHRSSGPVQIFPDPPPSVFKLLGEYITQSASSVALSFNGKILVIGSDERGPEDTPMYGIVNVYNFSYSFDPNGWWSGEGGVSGQAPNDLFGVSVAVANDTSLTGLVVAVGASQRHGDIVKGPGYVTVFRKDASGFLKQVGQTLVGENDGDYFGANVALSKNGRVLAVMASDYDNPDVGYAKVYGLNNKNVWVERGRLEGWRYSGTSLDISGDGRIVAIGGAGDYIDGSVRVYECSEKGGCKPFGQEILGVDYEDETGSSISLSESGTVVAIGAPGSYECIGRDGCSTVKVYGRKSENVDWSLVGQELSGGIGFGEVVRLSADATRLAVQGPFPSDDPWYYEPDETLVQLYRLSEDGIWLPDGAPLLNHELLDLSGDGKVVSTRYGSSESGVWVGNYLYTGN